MIYAGEIEKGCDVKYRHLMQYASLLSSWWPVPLGCCGLDDAAGLKPCPRPLLPNVSPPLSGAVADFRPPCVTNPSSSSTDDFLALLLLLPSLVSIFLSRPSKSLLRLNGALYSPPPNDG